jgi:protein-S-isoprenylcysteine O-methyltransferase Ste14
MEQRLSRWGVGPRTFVPPAFYTLAALAVANRWPNALVWDWLPIGFGIAGAILMLAGLVMWIEGGVTIMRAYNRDQLVTTGVCGRVRHPIYSAWITFIFPGLALVTRIWPLFLTPLIVYTIFKLLIHREDEYLERRFGNAYREYRSHVREVLPIPRR